MRRLIEEAFPLQEVSAASRHEKSVRHGHISTLHIWPARRPLAASRAALLAALLPDPGDPDRRQHYLNRIAALAPWGKESGDDLQALAREIRAAHGGRAPRVLDPFAGGGAIPFEAMRLGCEVLANDYNPVAWFLLKCTLDYPNRLAGQRWPLPPFSEAAASIGSARRRGTERMQSLDLRMDAPGQGDLEAHVRAWGAWVLERARAELGAYYPEVEGHPAVAYLWARTIPCQDPVCNAEVPLLRTLWLCKKPQKGKTPAKLRALRMIPDREHGRVRFEVYAPGSTADLKDRGTMGRTGVTCPCCGAFMKDDYVASTARAGHLGAVMTCVVVDTPQGKGYRAPSSADESAVQATGTAMVALPASEVPDEPLPPAGTLGFRVQRYGFGQWRDLFTPRQLLAIATFVRLVRQARAEMERLGYPA